MKVLGRESTADRRDIELLHHAYGSAGLRFLDRVGTPDDNLWWRVSNKKANARDHLAHMALVEETGLKILLLALGRSQPEAAAEASNVADLGGQPTTKILETLHETVAEQLSTLLALEDDGLLEMPVAAPGWRRPGTLTQLFDHMYVEAVVHYQRIRGALGGADLPHWWEGWMPEDSHDFYNRFFSLLPVLYEPTALTARPGRIAIALRPPGGGYWEMAVDSTEARLSFGGAEVPASSLQGRAFDFLDFWMADRGKIRSKGPLAAGFRNLFPPPGPDS
jgi:hypothetical protein